MTRTPLLGSLLRALNLAREAERRDLPTAEVMERREEGAERDFSRRQVLRASAAAAGGIALASCGVSPSTPSGSLSAQNLSTDPVVIIGAGIAGLTVAYRLHQRGIPYRVIEASERAGGRMLTLRGHFSKPVEIGAELIDSWHVNLRTLAKELKLPLIDLAQSDSGLIPQWYDFGGRRYSETEAVEAFRPLARRIDDDLKSLGGVTVSYRDPEPGRRLDRLSIREYLIGIGASGWMLELLDVAYTIEYGLAASEQSCLNFLYLVGNRPGQFEIFGYSDERYGIEGGNDQVPTALARIVGANIQYGTWLEAASLRRDGRYTLSLRQGSTRSDLVASRVVFALPFTTLRRVDLRGLPLPTVKRRVIQELGYGTNSKLIAGFTRRIWRDRYGSCGEVFTDRYWQNSWEASRATPGTGGVLTNYLGGQPGLDVGTGTPQEQADRWLSDMDKLFPGLQAARSAEAPVVAFWPGSPYVRASYACYTPGQWSELSGAEAETVGRLHFCGEHTSIDAQGYMEGGVESGERVAREIIGLLGARPGRGAGVA